MSVLKKKTIAAETKSDAQKDSESRKRKIYNVFLILIVFLIVWRAADRKSSIDKIGQKVAEPTGKISGDVSRDIIVATTTSLYDSGLLNMIIPAFEKDSGYKVKVIAVGTGEALEMGRRQVADLLLVHAAELEKKFMAAGCGDRREEIMASEFVIVGPASDPALIRGKSFPEAFSAIARLQMSFISRGDNSGTHFLEKKIWTEAGINPSGKWYFQVGQGMAESLRIGSEKQAYILSDYPTFHQLGSKLQLEVLTRDPACKNIYSAIMVKNRNGQVNVAGARALADFLVSEKAQKLIYEFGGEPAENLRLFQPLRLSLKENR